MEPINASKPPCTRKTRSTCSRRAPIALKIPISRVRCVTVMANTLAMPKATEIATKKLMTDVEMRCEVKAFMSCALDSIQLSDFSPVNRPILAATTSAANKSRTVTSMRVTPPDKSSSDCACFKSRYTYRRSSSRTPNSKMPVTVTMAWRLSPASSLSLSRLPRPRSSASSFPMTALPAPNSKLTRDNAFTYGNNFFVSTRINTHQRHSFNNVSATRKRGAGNYWRHGSHLG